MFPRTDDLIFYESLCLHPIPLQGYVPRPFISISLSPPEGDSIHVLPAVSFWKRERYRLSYRPTPVHCREHMLHLVFNPLYRFNFESLIWFVVSIIFRSVVTKKNRSTQDAPAHLLQVRPGGHQHLHQLRGANNDYDNAGTDGGSFGPGVGRGGGHDAAAAVGSGRRGTAVRT